MPPTMHIDQSTVMVNLSITAPSGAVNAIARMKTLKFNKKELDCLTSESSIQGSRKDRIPINRGAAP